MPRSSREIAALPECGGAYGLVLRCAQMMRVRVGALGTVELRPGYYVYVGSARSGLQARLARHLRLSGKRMHWHVDYVRRRTRPVAIFYVAGDGATERARSAECSRSAECALSDAVAARADGSVKGFGCSDCACASHLHYFREEPVGRVNGVQWVLLKDGRD